MTHDENITYSGRGLGLSRPTADGGQPFDAPTRTPRLLLRARGEVSEGVDGAWWPRTTNLTTELHDLISALTDRVGTTERVAFDWNSLSISQRGIDRQDGIEVSGPDPDQPPDIMYVFGTDGRRLDILIVGPNTDADNAFEAMQRAVGLAPDR
ncbi:DUF5994 family protein [Rhodococcus opacus]|uniref:DUF5994 family protein n=1 Tax=Rhodococcus opacus TaxID=37919 RepID=UPI0002A408D2|nr:DUF5994 family protein [Rhodococcus opacus]ELB87731.1 hypothetical protein Rwratislav_38321 [Rhodococcus wratislaviensis IFP 2016]MDV6242829.1 DUF5994 family protein [Rhodococcus opacus]MDX5968139.1 DUF5994 family protein [Rhodococcus opacus]NKY73296.1 hypothetical protein [Rhodococcus opacus]WKN55947.1 DUF5994 family protein [Rhodococcus opacus]